ELRVGLQQVRVELRLRVRGLDDGDPDTPRAQLVVERFRIALDRVLRRRVERPVRHRQEPKYGADVDDATAPLPAHVRHDGASHPDESEEVRLEDRSSLLDRALFRPAGSDTEAGV